MVSSLYTAASGMISEIRRLDVVANNLANVDTPGFKREGITFSDYFYHTGLIKGSPKRFGPYRRDPNYWFNAQNAVVFPDEHYFSFTPGALKETGNPLHAAIDGGGFFAVEGPAGTLLTRAGNFRVGPDGVLKTVDGYPVLGRVAPNMPPEPIVVDPNRPVEITADGWVVQNGNRLFRIEVVDFNGDYNRYVKAFGYSYFAFKNPKQRGFSRTDYRLMVGYLETSNADVVREMVNLITCMRHYEACQKAVQVTFEDTTSRVINDVGNVGR